MAYETTSLISTVKEELARLQEEQHHRSLSETVQYLLDFRKNHIHDIKERFKKMKAKKE